MFRRITELAAETGASVHEIHRTANMLAAETGADGIYVAEPDPPAMEMLTEILQDRLLTEDAVAAIKKLLSLG
jgi:hypothetical protein